MMTFMVSAVAVAVAFAIDGMFQTASVGTWRRWVIGMGIGALGAMLGLAVDLLLKVEEDLDADRHMYVRDRLRP